MIKAFFDKYMDGSCDIAVAVSGGADSMALCFALSEYLSNDITIHALTVDHGLRLEAGDEALHVAQQLARLPNIEHHILKWEHSGGATPDARIQELARNARYDLMGGYMRERDIAHLFLGHHMGDQAETFLFRLAKGSGIDGLSCMLPLQKMVNDVILCRPMLDLEKSYMIDFCADRAIEYIDDPSNKSDNYARVRLRKSMDILASEGLSAKRLSVCAARHARARKALEYAADKGFEQCILQNDAKRIVFAFKPLTEMPEEIVLRIVITAMAHLTHSEGYGARLERVENLCSDLMTEKPFRKRTLGGLVFEHNSKDNTFVIFLER